MKWYAHSPNHLPTMEIIKMAQKFLHDVDVITTLLLPRPGFFYAESHLLLQNIIVRHTPVFPSKEMLKKDDLIQHC